MMGPTRGLIQDPCPFGLSEMLTVARLELDDFVEAPNEAKPLGTSPSGLPAPHSPSIYMNVYIQGF